MGLADEQAKHLANQAFYQHLRSPKTKKRLPGSLSRLPPSHPPRQGMSGVLLRHQLWDCSPRMQMNCGKHIAHFDVPRVMAEIPRQAASDARLNAESRMSRLTE